MSSDNEVWEHTSKSEQSHGSDLSIKETYRDSNSSNNREELPYDVSVESIATPEEHAEYEKVVSLQETERQQLAAWFLREETIDSW